MEVGSCTPALDGGSVLAVCRLRKTLKVAPKATIKTMPNTAFNRPESLERKGFMFMRIHLRL